MNKQRIFICKRYLRNKVAILWKNRSDLETRCEIRHALRKLLEIRNYGDTLQAF